MSGGASPLLWDVGVFGFVDLKSGTGSAACEKDELSKLDARLVRNPRLPGVLLNHAHSAFGMSSGVVSCWIGTHIEPTVCSLLRIANSLPESVLNFVGVLEILCQSFNLSGKGIESWQRNLILKPP